MPSALTVEERHHPAKFSGAVLETMKTLFDHWALTGRVLDPYAGVGWIHRLSTIDRPTFAVELEQPWARSHGHAGRTIQADAARLDMFAEDTFAAVATSPVYPNRMRDHHAASDDSERKTYTHQMRKLTGDRTRRLHTHNMGAMTNTQYRRAAQLHIAEFKRVTVGDGWLFLNMSNSIDGHAETNAVEQWLNWLTLAGCHIRHLEPVETPRLNYGENWEARVQFEAVIVAQFPTKKSQGSLL